MHTKYIFYTLIYIPRNSHTAPQHAAHCALRTLRLIFTTIHTRFSLFFSFNFKQKDASRFESFELIFHFIKQSKNFPLNSFSMLSEKRRKS